MLIFIAECFVMAYIKIYMYIHTINNRHMENKLRDI